MIEPWTLPLATFIASIVFSATAIWVTIHGLRDKANTDYVRTLETRLAHAEDALKECERKSAQLAEENFDLMRRLMHLENITQAREVYQEERSSP